MRSILDKRRADFMTCKPFTVRTGSREIKYCYLAKSELFYKNKSDC